MHRIRVDIPQHVEFSIVVNFDKVGYGCTRVLYLLVTVAKGGEDDGTVGDEFIGAVTPVHDAGDAIGLGA